MRSWRVQIAACLLVCTFAACAQVPDDEVSDAESNDPTTTSAEPAGGVDEASDDEHALDERDPSADTSDSEERSRRSGLIPAAYPECADLGELVFEYLTTGDASGIPELTQQLAGTRSSILSSPDDAREDLARAAASNAIEACDAQQSAIDRQAAEAAAAQAEAEERAAERAAAEAAEQAQRDRYRDACQSLGGYISAGGTCLVDYPGWPAQIVAINPDGSFDTSQAEMNRQDCDVAMADAAISAQDGFPWSQLPEYHAETGVCVYGSP